MIIIESVNECSLNRSLDDNLYIYQHIYLSFVSNASNAKICVASSAVKRKVNTVLYCNILTLKAQVMCNVIKCSISSEIIDTAYILSK